MRRWDVCDWSLEVKIEVHQLRMVGVSGRSWNGCQGVVSCWRRDERGIVGFTLRMYGFVGWNDLGTMLVREGISSKVAWQTVNEFVGEDIVLEVLWYYQRVVENKYS